MLPFQVNLLTSLAAYTSVKTKTKLSRPSQPSQHSVSAPSLSSQTLSTSQANKPQWPEPLKKFVSSCFDQVDPKDTPEMEKQLKEVITKAFELGSTWTIDWSKATLPILELRKKEKKRALEKEKDFTSNKKAKSIRKRYVVVFSFFFQN